MFCLALFWDFSVFLVYSWFYFIWDDLFQKTKSTVRSLHQKKSRKNTENKSEGLEKKHNGHRELHVRPDSSVTQPYYHAILVFSVDMLGSGVRESL